ncbi:hypothetical protein DMENIID0001_132140 [Sergentomyia squamirostris]
MDLLPQVASVDTIVKEEPDIDTREMCRLCAKRFDGNSTSIFDENLHVDLTELFNCSIMETDPWPKTVCEKCVKKAGKTIKFVRSLRKSEEIFKALYGDEKQGEESCATVQFIVTEVSPEKAEVTASNVALMPDLQPFPQTVVHANDLLGGKSCEQMLRELLPGTLPTPSEKSVGPIRNARINPIQINHHEIETFYTMCCPICKVSCKTLKNLRVHFRDKHHQWGYVICCNKKIHRDCDMMDHKRYHSNPEAFRCDLCGKTKDLDTQTSLRKHMETSHSRLFEKRSEVYSMLKNTTKTIQHPCAHCNKFYVLNEMMTKHVKKVNKPTGVEDMCMLCKKVFKCGITLEKHMRKHEFKPKVSAKPGPSQDNDTIVVID